MLSEYCYLGKLFRITYSVVKDLITYFGSAPKLQLSNPLYFSSLYVLYSTFSTHGGIESSSAGA